LTGFEKFQIFQNTQPVSLQLSKFQTACCVDCVAVQATADATDIGGVNVGDGDRVASIWPTNDVAVIF
jgi:hypothetical protein